MICPDPTFAFFNDLRIDAIDFTPQKLLDALMPMPMMEERKLVTVSGLNFNTMSPKELDELCEVLEELKNYDYNLLILNVAADGLDPGYIPKKPSAVLQKLASVLTPVRFERCTTAKLTSWIEKHFAHNEIRVTPALCAEMVDYCGHSMFVLANEIDKLSYFLLFHGKNEATSETMRMVCTPANEYDAFAFGNAIMAGDRDTALAILSDLRLRKVDPVKVLGEVTQVICNMLSIHAMTADGAPAQEMAAMLSLHTYALELYQKSLRKTTDKRLRRVLEACIQADTALKNFSKGYTPLERLICSL